MENGLKVRDSIPYNHAVSLLHLAPGIRVLFASLTEVHISTGVIIEISGATEVRVTEDYISRYYNRKEQVFVLELYFSKDIEYYIRIS